MVTGHVFIACSLDGFIARDNDDLDWLEAINTHGEDHGYTAMMSSVDGIIMGRATFVKVLSFDHWPYEKPVMVMSGSLLEADIPPALRGRVDLCAQAPEAAMRRVHERGWKRAYIDGGRLIQSFLARGLIEDMVITRVPVLLGSGRTLFGPLERDIRLFHEQTCSFPSGLVSSRYRVSRDEGTTSGQTVPT